MAKITFFTEDIQYTLKHKTSIRNWIEATILAEGYQLAELNFIFMLRRLFIAYKPRLPSTRRLYRRDYF
ncbi:hypothetical protein ACHMWN_05000 [Pedobacter sp. UC225_61]|uniref:hypothetical protein n=1 Tax=Pedobacter sp. UC225_61 TaxID=3374623 RepID=UPI00378B6C38